MKAKLSNATFKYLLSYLVAGMLLREKKTLLGKTFKAYRHLIIEAVFSPRHIEGVDGTRGEDIVIEGVVLTRLVLRELIAIAKKEESELKLRFIKVGDTEHLFFNIKKMYMTITLPFDPKPFEDEDRDSDCLGDYDIDLNGNVDFGYSIEH